MDRVENGHREGESKSSAMAESAFDGDLSALGLDEAAHEGEAKSGAAVGGAGEAVEEVGEAFGFNPTTGVADCELDEVLDLFSGEQDFTVGGRVAKCVGDEVVEDGAHGATVGLDVGKIGKGLDLDANAFFAGFFAVAIANLIEER